MLVERLMLGILNPTKFRTEPKNATKSIKSEFFVAIARLEKSSFGASPFFCERTAQRAQSQ